MFSQVSATLQGLYTIRSYGMEGHLLQRFNDAQDQHTSAWFLFIASIRWLGLRIDLTIVVFQTVILVAVMLLPSTGELDLQNSLQLLLLISWRTRGMRNKCGIDVWKHIR